MMIVVNIWQIFGLAILVSFAEAAPSLGGRIVGGYTADIKDISFQVSLQTNYHFCGGSLIAKQYVLTAAHCTYEHSASKPRFQVRLGSEFHAKGGIIVKPIQLIRHKEYNPITVSYDFSIVKLEDYSDSSLPFQIVYVQLPWKGDIEDGAVMTVSGWGYTRNSSETRETLRAANVPKVNAKVCAKSYSRFATITDQMICAGYSQGGKDACQGDSGGPLFKGNVIFGVVSWGYGCAKPKYPGVYSRVSSVLEWIKSIIEE